MRFVDSPMGGGTVGAEKGALVFMVGAENEEEFEYAKHVLKPMGGKFFHCGGPGTGSASKISHNLVLGIHMIATSEGLAMGEKLGIDPKKLCEILQVSTANSTGPMHI